MKNAKRYNKNFHNTFSNEMKYQNETKSFNLRSNHLQSKKTTFTGKIDFGKEHFITFYEVIN